MNATQKKRHRMHTRAKEIINTKPVIGLRRHFTVSFSGTE